MNPHCAPRLYILTHPSPQVGGNILNDDAKKALRVAAGSDIKIVF